MNNTGSRSSVPHVGRTTSYRVIRRLAHVTGFIYQETAMHLRFDELSPRQQEQARARFFNAGTARDDYWYEICFGDVLCRTRNNPAPEDEREAFGSYTSSVEAQ